MPHSAAESLSADVDDLEVVPVEVHRVRHHRHVAHDDLDPFSFTDAKAVAALNPPVVAAHAACQPEFEPTVGRTRGKRCVGCQPLFELETDERAGFRPARCDLGDLGTGRRKDDARAMLGTLP